MANRGYGGGWADVAEGVGTALVYGGARSFVGNRAAADIIAKAGNGGTAPTAAQIVAAEKTVYATVEPAATQWQIPAVGVVLGAVGKVLEGYTGRPAWGRVGDGLLLPAASDFGGQAFAYMRRSQLKVTPNATRSFVGGARAPRANGAAAPAARQAQAPVGYQGFGGSLATQAIY